MRVLKTECRTADDLFAFVSARSDGHQFVLSAVDNGDHFEVEVGSISDRMLPTTSSGLFPDNALSEKQIDQFERPEFPSAGPTPKGSWTYGIATDLGNPDAKPVEEPVAAELKQHNDDLEQLLERMKPYR